MEKITVLIADHYRMLREAWKQILNSDGRFLVVGEAAEYEEVIEKVKQTLPNVILLDLHLPSLQGLAITKLIGILSPNSNIIGISNYNLRPFANKILEKGALGFITRNSSREELITGTLQVAQRNQYICSETKQLFDAGKPGNNGVVDESIRLLTPREREVVELIKEGYSSREIANRIFISEKTVEIHRYNILKKLKLENRVSLVNYVSLYGVT